MEPFFIKQKFLFLPSIFHFVFFLLSTLLLVQCHNVNSGSYSNLIKSLCFRFCQSTFTSPSSSVSSIVSFSSSPSIFSPPSRSFPLPSLLTIKSPVSFFSFPIKNLRWCNVCKTNQTGSKSRSHNTDGRQFKQKKYLSDEKLISVKRDEKHNDQKSRRNLKVTKHSSPKSTQPKVDSPQRKQSTSLFIHAEALVRTVKRDQLDVVIKWQIDSSMEQDYYFFVVLLARLTCNLYSNFPHCEDPDSMKSKKVAIKSTKGSVVFSGLSHNSRYWAEVEFKGRKSHKIWITTPGCLKPLDKTFKKCLDNSTSSPDLVPYYHSFLQDPWLKPNISCMHLDRLSQTGHVWIDWSNLHMEFSQIFDSEIEEGEVQSVVLVNFFSKKKPNTQLHHISNLHFHLIMFPDVPYEVKVKSQVRNHEIVFETLRLNISSSFSHNDSCHQIFFSKNSSENKKLTWALMVSSLGCMVLLFFFFLLLFAFCTKCRKAHTKLLKKTLLAKNNSYKTAPGVHVAFLKEEVQPVMGDEWELDAREVTLGSEIGQGAFGLVMTGYYRNCQVAIKVLKGDVSPSYRDELLKEIHMMKSIGRHGNIVSLVGACTLKDPIALIMEYMPFGNLQSFLQKCRVEGELKKTDRGSEMNYCPLDHLTGTKELLQISSTDLLSFARQISVAMEFITLKKYVHRDLAARNVLVTTNKVVKLCDFGLARVVHNGDQYCKLTNGRLPLKWMALESIRDRVFTAQSDVWAFGIFLWEITTFGSTPYPDVALVDLYRLLLDGYRMERPQNCSSELHLLMTECWHEEPSKRPTFSKLRLRLENLLSQKENYLDLDLVNSSLNRLKRPLTPIQPIEFGIFSNDFENHGSPEWKSNVYQEPRKVYGLSLGSRGRMSSGGHYMTSTTGASDSESNCERDEVFDQLD